jgi:hypothetical protein
MIGAKGFPDQLWGIEQVAELFPRIRILPGGVQRLTLDEQAQFITAHWQELELMFQPSRIELTRRVLMGKRQTK